VRAYNNVTMKCFDVDWRGVMLYGGPCCRVTAHWGAGGTKACGQSVGSLNPQAGRCMPLSRHVSL